MLIRFLTAIAVASLLLSTLAVVRVVDEAEQREQDRIASDLMSCERGNDNRTIYRELAIAQRDYVDAILTQASANSPAAERAEFEALLVEPRRDIANAIAQIVDVDCAVVVPGA